jgi:hypothetical protein
MAIHRANIYKVPIDDVAELLPIIFLNPQQPIPHYCWLILGVLVFDTLWFFVQE